MSDFQVGGFFEKFADLKKKHLSFLNDLERQIIISSTHFYHQPTFDDLEPKKKIEDQIIVKRTYIHIDKFMHFWWLVVSHVKVDLRFAGKRRRIYVFLYWISSENRRPSQAIDGEVPLCFWGSDKLFALGLHFCQVCPCPAEGHKK